MPPDELYHGSTLNNYITIDRVGSIKRMKRNAIHLTGDISMAWKSAKRWKNETPIVLVIDAKQMMEDGYKFGATENGVWCIVDGPRYEIPTQYIKGLEDKEKSICKGFEVVIDESYFTPGNQRLLAYIVDEFDELKTYAIEIKQKYTDVDLDFKYTLGATIKDMISFLDNKYYLTFDTKKAIAKRIKDAYEKYEKWHD